MNAIASPAPAADGQALPPRTRLGEFELLRVVGIGGFGIVYEARDHTLERRVAIKEYMPSTLAVRGPHGEVRVREVAQQAIYDTGLHSFVNEARLLARFDHPSLVKVHRFWQSNGTAYMVMPFHEGITLRQHLRALQAPPDEAWLRGVLEGLTGALQVIHGARCVHRDIAPDNILLLAGSDRPLLLDFGAARLVIADATQALTAILKPGYAPIEQYAEIAHLRQGPWTDVYALCAVIHTAITGHKPPPALGRMVRDDHVPLAPQTEGRAAGYSLALRRMVDAGLRPLPQDRPQDIDALVQGWALPAVDAGEQALAERTPRTQAASPIDPSPTPSTHAPGLASATTPTPATAMALDLELDLLPDGPAARTAAAGHAQVCAADPAPAHLGRPRAVDLELDPVAAGDAIDADLGPRPTDPEPTIRVAPGAGGGTAAMSRPRRSRARDAGGTASLGPRLALGAALLLAALALAGLARWWGGTV